jgi:hypothetical protein
VLDEGVDLDKSSKPYDFFERYVAEVAIKGA